MKGTQGLPWRQALSGNQDRDFPRPPPLLGTEGYLFTPDE